MHAPMRPRPESYRHAGSIGMKKGPPSTRRRTGREPVAGGFKVADKPRVRSDSSGFFVGGESFFCRKLSSRGVSRQAVSVAPARVLEGCAVL